MPEIIQSLYQLYATTKNSLTDGKISAAEAREIAREACQLVLMLLGRETDPKTRELAAAIHDWSATTKTDTTA